MGRAFVTTAILIAALSLAACQRSADRAAASGVCKPFTTATAAPQPSLPSTSLLPPAPAADPAAAVDDCLHRWGYTLAASSDPADVVADATIAACSPSLTTWNRSSLSTQGQNVQAPSLLSGQPTNSIAEHYAFAQGRALFYVVQARAGHCPPPPASTAPAK